MSTLPKREPGEADGPVPLTDEERAARTAEELADRRATGPEAFAELGAALNAVRNREQQ